MADRHAVAVVGLGRLSRGPATQEMGRCAHDEVFFRDTAHGLLAWALATAIVAVLFTLGSAAVVSSAAVATDAQVSAEAAEQARKAAASFSILTSLSLIIGAFIACVSGALGGYHRDKF